MFYKKTILIIQVLLISCSVIAQRLEKQIDLRGNWKFTIGDKPEWSADEANDTNWESIRVPGEWENQGFNGYDGFAWYRTSFEGSTLKNSKDIYLDLGYIDDADEVYINGQLVGLSGQFPPNFSTAYNARRIYYVPIEYINVKGQNTIAVRVYDTVQGGGIVSGNIGLYTPEQFMANALILEGVWQFEYGDNSEWKEVDFDDSNWGHKMVPAFWTTKHMDIKDYYDAKWGTDLKYGWYRKVFRLPGKLDGAELSLVLGRIDDFDEVYINGNLIGETNDGKGFGASRSFREMRVYRIPAAFLKNRSANVIAVRVADMGGEAGIYEGPIGIVESSKVDEFLEWGEW